ncbi:MAG: hypothetical protein NTX61_12820 [Bacteroidetes bacterium]|nr:hypothetical protein [Bacteroidota bacterium]
MHLLLQSPRKSLNKAYLKVKPTRTEIELFKENLITLLDGLNETESKEHVKIDQLVYELYGLTDEEIKIVEGN